MSSSNTTQEKDSTTENNLNQLNNFGQQQIPPNWLQFTHSPQPQSSQSQPFQSFNSPNNWVQPSLPFIAPNNWGQPSQFAIPTQFQHPSSFTNPSQSQSSQSHGTQSADLSQSEDAVVVDGQKNKGKRRSTTKGSQLLKWTGNQNKNLAKAWVHVSEDRIKSNNQQLDFLGPRFWMHFMIFVNKMDDAAKIIYEARGKGKWLYKDAYEILSCHQYWKILQDQHPDTLARNVRMNQTSNSSPEMSTPATPDTPVSSNTDSPVLVTDEETERPDGIKSAKLRENNEKRQNFLIERQNVLISRIDRMEKKKEEYVVERDKKKEEYISERNKKKKDRDARIMKLRQRKTKAVVNLKAQFQAQNDQKVMAMDMSTLDDTQRIY
ncbi:hypothetical protein GIB67_024885 [Kingdonia uniflora]|uniref:No apical meristem-associated C-terminal domain-containing protein n=1 Tax=Kingdonia uniflora TaxID=39325 RepID=A0A7J7NYW1_9MAGN|nr:hypothetical protein GIB67_024885 [Kingdonia uniflora]